MTFYHLKNYANVPSKNNKQKTKKKNIFCVGILKVTDEKSRIRIGTKMSRIHNTERNGNKGNGERKRDG
jgi:hypothetical protein